MAVRRRRPLIVFLGNVGADPMLSGSKVAADMNRHMDFIGIDIKPYPKDAEKPGNLTQVRAEFSKGLDRIPNESADTISSQMALGYYDKGGNLDWDDDKFRDRAIGYTSKVMDLAYKKLKPGGALSLTVDQKQLPAVIKAISQSSFKGSNPSMRELPPDDVERTMWLANYNSFGKSIYEVTVKKPA